ncbi:hypothetical protein [Fervidibacillus albus]|uniref:DUF8042 domain-containing protein n=1 Tax=Fervidibacillus albus TaxID=2980026 RepID=A0A9E8LUA6_9BACI|nr:hypothetical protein [Fervidibacillus albus]WAA09793.1 hypothetical protein OE104_15015 [Fervidibacillus albus]
MKEVLELIESFNNYLLRLPKGVYYISECLRKDQLNEAFQTIKDFSEGVMWLSDATRLLKQNDVEVQLNINQIQAFLIEINEGLEKQDYVLVADLFEYEIAPFFEEIPQIVGVSS